MDEIEKFLKTSISARIDVSGKWLYWDDNQWVVRSHSYGQHRSSVEYTGDDINEALKILGDE